MHESWFQWVAAGVAGLLGWLGTRLHSRVDALEKDRATTAQLDRIADTVRQDITELRKEMNRGFADVNRAILDSVRNQR